MTRIITITESDRIDDIACVITESDMAVLTVEFENGDEEEMALERNQAEGLCDMIDDSYERHDELAENGRTSDGGRDE